LPGSSLAGGDDPDPRLFGLEDGPVDAIGAGEGPDRGKAPLDDPALLRQRRIGDADVQPVGRDHEIRGQDEVCTVIVDQDGTAAFHHVVATFERDPRAGEARHRNRQKAELENVLDIRRIEHRDVEVHHAELARMDGARRFRPVVVAEQDEHAAMARSAGIAAMAERIAGAVDPRALAVPQREHAVVLAIAARLGLLAAPNRGQCEILVQPRLETHPLGFKPLAGALELQVVGRKRRAAITSHITGGVEAGRAVAPALNQRQADERLDAGEEHPAFGEVVFVVERNRVHGANRSRRLEGRRLPCAIAAADTSEQ
jgi:hypothetical protein